jgi:hypothetical protein
LEKSRLLRPHPISLAGIHKYLKLCDLCNELGIDLRDS